MSSLALERAKEKEKWNRLAGGYAGFSIRPISFAPNDSDMAQAVNSLISQHECGGVRETEWAHMNTRPIATEGEVFYALQLFLMFSWRHISGPEQECWMSKMRALVQKFVAQSTLEKTWTPLLARALGGTGRFDLLFDENISQWQRICGEHCAQCTVEGLAVEEVFSERVFVVSCGANLQDHGAALVEWLMTHPHVICHLIGNSNISPVTRGELIKAILLKPLEWIMSYADRVLENEIRTRGPMMSTIVERLLAGVSTGPDVQYVLRLLAPLHMVSKAGREEVSRLVAKTRARVVEITKAQEVGTSLYGAANWKGMATEGVLELLRVHNTAQNRMIVAKVPRFLKSHEVRELLVQSGQNTNIWVRCLRRAEGEEAGRILAYLTEKSPKVAARAFVEGHVPQSIIVSKTVIARLLAQCSGAEEKQAIFKRFSTLTLSPVDAGPMPEVARSARRYRGA